MTSKLDLVRARLATVDLLGFGATPSKTAAAKLLGPKTATAKIGQSLPKSVPTKIGLGIPKSVIAKIGGPKVRKPV